MFPPITYKIVIDEQNNTVGLELHQGYEHITVTLSGKGAHENPVRWEEVKEKVEALKNKWSTAIYKEIV